MKISYKFFYYIQKMKKKKKHVDNAFLNDHWNHGMNSK